MNSFKLRFSCLLPTCVANAAKFTQFHFKNAFVRQGRKMFVTSIQAVGNSITRMFPL